ncbi:Zn-dependent hydrolase [Azotosporobacter soli]|uniref:Zn-dependent hydrolase n=1 Tax=Azotosporobacter soli TaxID=3055040 RepID=UPI0031FE5130
MINKARLAKTFAEMEKIGRDSDGGVSRLAFGAADWQGRDYVKALLRQAGLALREDSFGNLIARRAGTDPAAPVVMLGSHIDSVPSGGNYDGVVGVLAAIEVLQCLADAKAQHANPIEVVVFMAEESSRFGVATLGSKAFCGKLTREALERYRDKDGVSLAEALAQRGFDAQRVAEAKYAMPIKAFLELHIEQGKVLEVAKAQLGIVSGIAAPSRFTIVVNGQADHSGATPMDLRHDALAAAAEIILQVEKLAKAAADGGIVGTVGVIEAKPGAMNVIPGRVEMGVDIRGIGQESKLAVVAALHAAIEEITRRRGVAAEISVVSEEAPVKLAASMIELLTTLCHEQGYRHRLLPSGAGHDAMHLAALAPTGMLFIPCRDGISHNPAEHAEMADIAAGADILLAAVKKLAAVRI